jgi:PAS domain S-box-containing protein
LGDPEAGRADLYEGSDCHAGRRSATHASKGDRSLVGFVRPCDDQRERAACERCVDMQVAAAKRGGPQTAARSLERSRSALVATQERLLEAHDVARLSSWEWRPETDEVVVFQALPEVAKLSGARVDFSELLDAMPIADGALARDGLAAMVRGEVDESTRCSRYDLPSGPAWLETRSRAVRDGDGRLECVRGTTQDVTEKHLAAQDLISSRDFFQATLDSLPTEVAVLDEQGVVVMINRAWTTFAAAKGTVVGTGIGENYLAVCDAAHDKITARIAAGLREIIAGTSAEFRFEYPCHEPDLERWFVLRATRYDGPGSARVVVAHDEITARRRAEAEVATQAALLDEVDVAVIAMNEGGEVTRWNDGAQEMFLHTPAEAIGCRAVELIAEDERDRAGAATVETKRNGRWKGRLIFLRKDGARFPADVRVRQMVDEDGHAAGRISVLVDVTERVASERALVAAQNYARAVADGMGEGLCTIDPQGRLIYMNAAAERLLGWPVAKVRGQRLHDLVHTHRLDGEECVDRSCPILGVSEESEPVRVEEDAFTCRDGCALPVAYTAAPFVTNDGVDGCAVVFEDITERKQRQASMERDVETLSWIGRIQDALAEDRFELFAQPIIDLHSGEIVQRELLLRMREPDGQIVPPISYLPIAEQYGLIADIDSWVVGRATEIAAAVGAVQLNLSARSIGDPAIIERIEQCLEETGADPRSLVFEITETALIADEAAATAFVERVHALGCKLALDDFGTGYGGFTYLKHLPVDLLKIDVDFVRDLAANTASRHVVEAVVTLARAFGLQTVAEGVEDAVALRVVGELGVDFAQGYHIGRPAPLDRPTPSVASSDSPSDATARHPNKGTKP